MADQESRDAVLILVDRRGRQLLRADSLTSANDPPWPAEEIHWVASAPGEIRIELKLPAPDGRPCGLRLAGPRRATATDRRRALAEAELARGHALRRTYEPERCRAGIEPYESAQRRFADLGLPRRRAEALSGLGVLQHKCLHDAGAALQAFTKAEPLFAGDPSFEAVARHYLGEIRSDLHDYGGAAGECRRALELNRWLGRTREGRTANTLGYALHRLGRYDEAAVSFERALALWQPEDDPRDKTQALLNRGQLHRDLGEAGRARERFQAALELSRRQGDRGNEAVALNALGIVDLDTGQPGAALGRLQGALALRPPGTRGRAVTLSSLGVAYRQLGQKDKARRAYAEALPIFQRLGDSREESRCLANLGRLEASTGQDKAALSHLDRALALFQTFADPPQRARALEGKAWVLRRRGDLEGARALLEEALAAVERHRFSQESYATRAEFFATQQGFYDFLTGLLMEMHRKEPAAGYAAAALEVHERSLARSLLDGLAARGVDLPGERELTQPRPWSAAEIQGGLLDRDTLLLEYRLGDDRSFLWAVTPDSLEGFELPGRAVLEPVVRQALGSLARSYSRPARFSAGLRLAELSRRLLGPVAPRLGSRRLLVVGDGALQSLPFAALPDPGDGEPLAARHEILSLPSVSALGVLRRETAGRPPAPKTLWVLADPAFGGRFPLLPDSGREAAAILALAPGPNQAVQGPQASRSAVLGGALRDYRFLHFATHHSFTAGDPDGGRLVLAQVGPDGRRERNGFLRLPDIYGLDLRADLVVLSACQSALGREVRGEGMMGMTRGFFHAGAERVLVSLWNVPDQVTVELMRRFYHGMLAEGLSPAAALRKAQNAIRRERGWQAPYYWAGFTLQGEWRPLRRNGPAGKTGEPVP